MARTINPNMHNILEHHVTCIASCCAKKYIMCNEYLTLRLVLSLNNPQIREMNFCENMKLTS